MTLKVLVDVVVVNSVEYVVLEGAVVGKGSSFLNKINC